MNEYVANLSAGDAAFGFDLLAERVLQESIADLHHYYVSDISRPDIQNLRQTVAELSDYFKARNFFDRSLDKNACCENILLLGGGTTEGFGYLIRLALADAQRRSVLIGHSVQPVILFSVPTYGYFLQQAELWGLAPVTVNRGSDGTLSPGAIYNAFLQTEMEGKRIAAFYDCTPHNPLGTIRTRSEAAELAEVLLHINTIYRMQDRELGRATKHAVYPSPNIMVIDDLVYDDLVFDAADRSFSFYEHEELRGNVAALLGLSKVGLAGFRAGVLIASKSIVRRCYDLQIAGTYFPNLPATLALRRYYSTDDTLTALRHEHLRRLNKAHEFGGKLMKALIDGLPSVPCLSAEDLEDMISAVAEGNKVERNDALRRLYSPMDSVRVLTQPRSGFFHMLDFEDLRGKIYHSPDGQTVGPIHGDSCLSTILRRNGLHVCLGSWTGLDQSTLVARVSFSAPPVSVVLAIERLRATIASFPKT